MTIYAIDKKYTIQFCESGERFYGETGGGIQGLIAEPARR